MNRADRVDRFDRVDRVDRVDRAWRARARRRVAAFGLHLVLGAGVHAEPEPPTACPPTPALPSEDELRSLKAVAQDRGFLWRLRKEDRTSWLYGTIHVSRREWAMPGPEVSRALRAVDTVALELDPLDPGVQAGLAQGMAGLRRPALPEALTERLAQRARDDCLPEAGFAALAPAAQAMVLTTQVGRRDGLDPAYGVDALLAVFGHSRKLDVVSLETPALQLGVIDMGNDADTVAWVDGSLGEIERGAARAQLETLAAAWADGRLDAMTPCPGGDDCTGSAQGQALKRRVLDDRNPALAASIDALHSSGRRVFAAVGSLHMVGPNGLPALLEARGYEVARVVFERP